MADHDRNEFSPHHHPQWHQSVLLSSSSASPRRVGDTFTVASSSLSAWTSQLASQLQSCAATLTEPLQSLLRNVTPSWLPDHSAVTFSERTFNLLSTYSTASYTTVAATLLAILFLAYKYLMTSYNYRDSPGESSWGGRRSPYTSTFPRNVSDFYEYVEPSYYEPVNHHKPSVARPHPSSYQSADEEPDVLFLRHKGACYELTFPAFAIGDEDVLVGDVRDRTAQKLRTDPRRLRLLYKGKKLTENSWPARKYGLKQHSEVSCVISDVVSNSNSRSPSSSDDDTSSVSLNKHPRRRTRGTSMARHRSDAEAPSDEFLDAYRGNPKSSGDSLRVPGQDRQPSHSRGSSPNPVYSSQTSSGSSNTPTDSPLGKLQALSSTFHTKWLLDCTRFIGNPPSDPKQREQEYRKLNESVLVQIVMKADEIDVQGNQEARSYRKQLVEKANDVMKRLDAVGKPKSGGGDKPSKRR